MTRATTFVLSLLLLLLVSEVIVATRLHRTAEDLEESLVSEDPGERAAAMHVLANRGEPRVFSPDETRRLLEGESALLRELAMTHLFSRGAGDALQRAWAEEHRDASRAIFFYRYQQRGMTRETLRDYFEASSR